MSTHFQRVGTSHAEHPTSEIDLMPCVSLLLPCSTFFSVFPSTSWRITLGLSLSLRHLFQLLFSHDFQIFIAPTFQDIVLHPSNIWCITHSSSLFALFCFPLTPHSQVNIYVKKKSFLQIKINQYVNIWYLPSVVEMQSQFLSISTTTISSSWEGCVIQGTYHEMEKILHFLITLWTFSAFDNFPPKRNIQHMTCCAYLDEQTAYIYSQT